MRTYSPRPLEDYKSQGETLVYRPAETLEAWNLIWLSIPLMDRLLDPNHDFTALAAELNFKQVGYMQAMSRFTCDDQETLVADLMGPSPLKFVQDLQDLINLPGLNFWAEMGGQTWVDTMVARAYLSAGLADVHEAAAKSANVIVADFAARRRA